MQPSLVNAEDVALPPPTAVTPADNLLEAMRDFGSRDAETLPVRSKRSDKGRLVGLLLRADVMRRYREEMLQIR